MSTITGGSQWLVNGETHYQRNRETYLQKVKQRQRALCRLVQALKANPCKDCGKSYPFYCMDFDHTDPTKKTCNPSDMAQRGWSEKRIMAELGGCDLVCAICHRIRTHKQRGGL